MTIQSSQSKKQVRLAALAVLGSLLLLSFTSAALADPPSAGSSSLPLSESETCVDQPLAKGLYNGTTEYKALTQADMYGAFDVGWNAQVKHPQLLKRPDLVCIDRIDTYFGQIQEIIEAYEDDTLDDYIGKKLKKFVKDAIKSLTAQALNAACTDVVIATQNAMELVCLPLPDLKLPDFAFPGLNRISCDGLSLGDYVDVHQNPTPLDIKGEPLPHDLMSVPMSRFGPDRSRGTTFYSKDSGFNY